MYASTRSYSIFLETTLQIVGNCETHIAKCTKIAARILSRFVKDNALLVYRLIDSHKQQIDESMRAITAILHCKELFEGAHLCMSDKEPIHISARTWPSVSQDN